MLKAHTENVAIEGGKMGAQLSEELKIMVSTEEITEAEKGQIRERE